MILSALMRFNKRGGQLFHLAFKKQLKRIKMKKTKMNLLMFDGIPEDAYRYLSNYGFHFNKKACEFAVSMMSKREAGTGKSVTLEMVSKDEVEAMLTKHNVNLENDCMYDSTYVANMLMSDMYKSSIPDEQHLALGIKDLIDDIDQRDGYLFVRWYSNVLFNGCPIDWSDLL